MMALDGAPRDLFMRLVAARARFTSRQAALVPSPQRGLRRGRAIHPHVHAQPPRERRLASWGRSASMLWRATAPLSWNRSPVLGESPARRSAAASRRRPDTPRRGTRRVLRSSRENSIHVTHEDGGARAWT